MIHQYMSFFAVIMDGWCFEMTKEISTNVASNEPWSLPVKVRCFMDECAIKQVVICN